MRRVPFLHALRYRASQSVAKGVPSRVGPYSESGICQRVAMEKERVSEYRRKAQECRAKAAKAADEASRFELLTMAKSWELLTRQAEKDEEAD